MQPQATGNLSWPLPAIVDRDAFHVAGVSYSGNNSDNQVSALWAAFQPRARELIKGSGNFATYGVIRTFPGARPDEFEYLVGVEVEPQERLPEGMERWRIPTQSYAVFPVVGPAALGPAIDHFYREWLPCQIDVEPSDGPSLEYYPADYPEQPIIHLHFPVRRRI